MSTIQDIKALEILDSRGNPTIKARVVTHSGITGEASVPSGASTGENEAVELRDQDMNRYKGKGVLKALGAVNGSIRDLLINMDVASQRAIDEKMIEADGTANKSRFGANAILAVSLAVAKAAAKTRQLSLYKYLGGPEAHILPCPMMNIINGGVHADNSLDFQEFMIRPVGAKSFSEALRWGTEVYHVLRAILKKEGHITAVGDEGGFAPNLRSHQEALDLIIRAIKEAGFTAGKDMTLALDAAASELWDKNGKGYLEKKRQKRGENVSVQSYRDMTSYYEKLIDNYPIDSIEDALAEHDWEGWHYLTEKLGKRVQLVGDDLFVTNPRFLCRGIDEQCCNSILIKVNQIGTLTETLDTIEMAKNAGYRSIISHRSGETEESFIADLAVATNAGQIKTGAPCRSDRVAKYNRLLEIENDLGALAVYSDSNRFRPRIVA